MSTMIFDYGRGDGPEEVSFPDTPFDLKQSLVLLGKRGSEAHGTYRAPTDPDSIDDRDLMGVCIPPERYYLGLSSWANAEAIKGPWDVVLYEFRKFVGLLMKQNPNVIGMLWLEPEDYLHISPAGQMLIDNRNLFRHRDSAYESFCGYARSQLNKMTADGKFAGYMGFKRKALVEKYGFDCKNAAHLVRLLHMGSEFLESGEMHVRRTWDRDTIMDIKIGKWSLDSVKLYAETQFRDLEATRDRSPLPTELDTEAIESVVLDCMRTVVR